MASATKRPLEIPKQQVLSFYLSRGHRSEFKVSAGLPSRPMGGPGQTLGSVSVCALLVFLGLWLLHSPICLKQIFPYSLCACTLWICPQTFSTSPFLEHRCLHVGPTWVTQAKLFPSRALIWGGGGDSVGKALARLVIVRT